MPGKGWMLSAAVWGQAYLDTFFGYLVPSLLSPGNLPRVVQDTRVSLLLFVRPEEAHRLASYPAYRALAALIPVEVRMLGPSVEDKYLDVSRCHQEALETARDRDEACTILFSDFVFGDGSLAFLADRFKAGHACVAGPVLSTVLEAMAVELAPYGSEGRLTVPSRALAGMAIRNLFPTWQGFRWGGDHANLHSSLLFWQGAEDEIVVACFHQIPFLVYLGGTQGPIRVHPTMDFGFLDAQFPGASGAWHIQDSDAFFCCEMSRAGSRYDSAVYTLGRVSDAERDTAWRRLVALWCAKYGEPVPFPWARRLARIHGGEPSARLAIAAEKAQVALEGVEALVLAARERQKEGTFWAVLAEAPQPAAEAQALCCLVAWPKPGPEDGTFLRGLAKRLSRWFAPLPVRMTLLCEATTAERFAEVLPQPEWEVKGTLFPPGEGCLPDAEAAAIQMLDRSLAQDRGEAFVTVTFRDGPGGDLGGLAFSASTKVVPRDQGLGLLPAQPSRGLLRYLDRRCPDSRFLLRQVRGRNPSLPGFFATFGEHGGLQDLLDLGLLVGAEPIAEAADLVLEVVPSTPGRGPRPMAPGDVGALLRWLSSQRPNAPWDPARRCPLGQAGRDLLAQMSAYLEAPEVFSGEHLAGQVETRFERWRHAGARIVIHGAARHTGTLLAETRVRELNLVAIADRDPATHGSHASGLPVVGPERIPGLRPDVILISTDAWMIEVQEELAARFDPGVELFSFYPRKMALASFLRERPEAMAGLWVVGAP